MSFNWAQSLLNRIAYVPMGQVALLFMLFGALQVLVPPFPGDIILFFGGSVWPGGYASDLVPVLLPYWLGTTVMSLLMYELGAKIGVKVFQLKWVKKMFSDTTRALVTRWLDRAGAVMLFAAKFVTGMNLPMLLLSGALGYKRKLCYPVIIVTTTVHNVLMYTLGTFLGDNWSQVASLISRYQIWFAAFVAAVILLVVCFQLFVKRLARRARTDEEEK